MIVIQFAIVGLVATEWAAKVRENTINTGVLAAAAADLFYAYDVYDFFEKQLHDDTVCMIYIARWVVFYIMSTLPPSNGITLNDHEKPNLLMNPCTESSLKAL